MKARAGWLLLAASLSVASFAQTSTPRVAFEGSVGSGSVAPNQSIDATFTASLPDGYHVNSNAPLEEFLKPTRLLLETPEGVSVAEIRYPEPLLFQTRFSAEPLAVYEHRFQVEVTLVVADLAPGDYPLVATLKYQACSDRVCYPPASRKTELTLTINGD
jgi:DsbC/DsbD-like thiol-disulfide interchange protein